MLVAVVDDGIIPEVCSIGKLCYDMTVTESGRVCPRKADELITTSHGTTVAGIIHKYAPEAEFCSIRIFSGPILKTSCKQLIAALKWCYMMKIPVINLSLGTTELDDFKVVRLITDKLLFNGQIVVAACNNNGMYTLPAMHPGVYGVFSDITLMDNQYRENPETNGVRFLASASHELTLTKGGTIRTRDSNSFAAPTITSAVVRGYI